LFCSIKNIALLVLFSLISGCGFEPLYVEKKSSSDWYYNGEFDTGIKDEMASVKIELIQDRIGQLIRNDLLDKLTPKGEPKEPKYIFSVTKIDKQEIDQALRNDITATRKKVIYKVSYTLKNAEHKTLINGNSVAYLGYDILRDPYSTTFAQKKNEKNAAKIIANDISLRLGAYFHSLQTKRGNPDEY
jgi:LPS-assembly lipoprotein